MAPARRPGSPPLVTVDVAEAYELLHSIVVSLDLDEEETYDADRAWIAGVRERAGDELLSRLRALAHGECDTYRHLVGVAYDAAAPRDVAAFLDHLGALDPIELKLHLVQFYTREARRRASARVIRAAVAGDAEARDAFLSAASPEWPEWTAYLRAVLEADGRQLRDDLVRAIGEWHDRVWKSEALTILPILERDAEAKRELQRGLEIEDFVRTATNGVEFAPRPGVERLVMVPSFFQRPVVSYVEYGEVLLIVYPVADESISADVDTPPLRLVRLSKALGDEKRLRILRALAEGERSLMELADMFGVAKTTMHHHMIVLRSAGLVSVGVGAKTYRLRHETVPDVGALLSGYLGAASGPSAASGPPAPVARQRRRRAAG